MDTLAKPQPRRDPLTRPFWDHAAAGRLAIQVCDSCGDGHFPPSPVCPNCNADEQSWQPVSGRGTLQSWVTFHRAYWPGFAADLPYDVCLVRLEEGPLLLGNIVGGKQGARLGAAVQVAFDPADDPALPQWRLAEAP